MINLTGLLLNRTLGFGLLIFALALGGGELLARYPRLQAHLPYPAVGGGYDDFESNLYEADAFVNKHGAPDCFFVGSSIVQAGISPPAFDAGFRRQTGQPMTCFNFGVQGMNPQIAPAIAEMLIRRYAPTLIIYGTALFEYNSYSYGEPSQTVHPLLESPWLRYQNGSFSVRGWLTERLLLYRYGLVLPEVLHEDAGPSPAAQLRHPFSVDGFNPRVDFTLSSPLILRTGNPRTRLDMDDRSRFEFYNTALEGLRTILQLNGSETRLLVLEMPTYALPDPPAARASLVEAAQQAGVPFWQTTYLGIDTSAEDFVDPFHLHYFAAVDFSYWLGQQVGAGFSGEPSLADLRLQHYEEDITGWLEAHQPQITPVIPAESRIFNPASVPYDDDFIARTLGLYMMLPSLKDDLPQLYELLTVVNQMQFEHSFSDAERAGIEQWRVSFEPQALKDVGIEYLAYTDVWYSFTSEATAALLDDPARYERVGQWWNPALQENFLLFRLGDAS